MFGKKKLNYTQFLKTLQVQGESPAFAYLKAASKKLIYSIVLKQGGKEHQAKDIWNETTEDVFQKLVNDEYDPERSSLVTFTHAVANNKWLNLQRSIQNRKKHEQQFLETHPPLLLEEDITEERLQQVVQALLKLGDPCYTILKSYVFEGEKLKDIAAMLDISEDAAKQRKKRCVEKLRKMLHKKYE